MDLALQAVAKIAHIDPEKATKFIRQQPLFDQEIHIEEELINLEESFKTFHIAAETLSKYPNMRYHAIQERRAILQHCIGLIARMQTGQPLPRTYDIKDTHFAMHKLIKLMVDDARKLNYKIDDHYLEIWRPYMTWRQKLYHSGFSFNPLHYARLVIDSLPFTD